MTGKTLEKYLIKNYGTDRDQLDTLAAIFYEVTPVDVISNSDKFQEAFENVHGRTSGDLYVDMVLGLCTETVAFCIHQCSGEVLSTVEFTWPELVALGIFTVEFTWPELVALGILND